MFISIVTLWVILFLLWISTLYLAPWYPIWILRLILIELFWLPTVLCVLVSGLIFLYIYPKELGWGFLILAVLYTRPYLYYLLKTNQILSHTPHALFEVGNFLLNNEGKCKVRQSRCFYMPEKHLEIFSPKNKEEIVGAILCIHGGAWRSGSPLDFAYTHRQWARKGIAVYAPQYSLSPGVCFPTQIDELKLAWKYMLESMPVGIPVYILGRSAGGQLAGILASKLGKQVSGLILMYTPSDLYWGYQHPGNPKVLDSRAVLRNYLGGELHNVPEVYEAASVNYQITAHFPPTLMLHGLQDELVAFGHNFRLIEALSKQNIPYLCVAIPYATHGFDYFYHSISARFAEQRLFFFLEKYRI